MKIRITLLLALFLAFFSCKKKDIPDYSNGGNDTEQPGEGNLSSEKELLSFKFVDTVNQGVISETIEGVLDSDTVKLDIPDSYDIHHLIPSFEYKGKSVLVNDQKQKSGETAQDFTQDLIYEVVAEDSSKKSYVVKIERTTEMQSVLPHIYITVDNNGKITSKDDYVHGDIKIDGKGEFDDYEGRTKIRGRGNTSWGWDKKPYKLKLYDKTPLFGLASYKKWILLANYNDRTLLMNSIPYKMGHLLGLPYTNDIIPVQFTLNGEDQGFYVFTEHKEVGPDRIDIGKGDNAGVLLELDSYFDEPYQFKSEEYQLPVMIKYPKLRKWDDQQAINTRFEEIKDDFNAFEALVADPDFPNNNYLDYFDKASFVKYMIIYMMTDNEEINHPKSTYINKPEGSQKYHMGIIWDFDWGFGFEAGRTHFDLSTAQNDLFWSGGQEPGTLFFQRIFSDPEIKSLFKETWNDFKGNKYASLKQNVEKYAEVIRPVYDKEHTIWGTKNAFGVEDTSGDLDTDVQTVLDWLDARVDYIDSYVAGF